MQKKYLSCLVYTLLLAISFLLAGLTEASGLPQKSVSLLSKTPLECNFTKIRISASPTPKAEGQEKSIFLSLEQTAMFAVAPDASSGRRQSELIRKFPVAALLMSSLQLVYWHSAVEPPYFFSAHPSAVPGLPVLLRSLRL